jgi:hypothetical protein
MDLDNYKPSMISVSVPSDFEIEVSDYHERTIIKNLSKVISMKGQANEHIFYNL